MPEAFQRTMTRYGDRVALRTYGDALRLTWAELGHRVRRVAAGLTALGVWHGDMVSIVLPNTPDCDIVDFAAVHVGASAVRRLQQFVRTPVRGSWSPRPQS
ncbi:AMP-binding protein [Streptomyces sp. NPDC002012]|uniref:AMP-binding protein n=1 Tax=Streptomyces sp. NPDC002012 TaxID=3154532 RepID=UPI00331939C0